jgi:hypothetical protein
MKMERTKTRRVHRVSFRLTNKEYEALETDWKRSIIVKLAEYVRRVLFDKPIKFYTRNQSLDELMAELILLRRELNRIGSNFERAAEVLQSLEHLPQVRRWLAQFERDKAQLASNLAAIKTKIDSISEQWLQ